MSKNYVVVAGSFDYLHEGHKALLRLAFAQPEEVLVGLMEDAYLARKSKNFMPLRQRKAELRNFLKQFHRFYRIVLLSDTYGPAISSEVITKIVISSETAAMAEEINEIREGAGLAPLKILEVPLLKDQNGKRLSSGAIRQGLIDRKGRNYFPKLRSDFKLKSLQKLKKPWGSLLPNKKVINFLQKLKTEQPLITVGDITTGKFLKEGIIPNLAIVDNRVERQELERADRIPFSSFEIMYKVQNPAGMISLDLLKTLRTVLPKLEKKHQVILVKGEEDLATLAVLLLGPLQARIFYGQPGEGLVSLILSEKLKQKAARFF